MTNLTPGDRDVSRFNAAIRQLYQGGLNNTGSVTLRASQTTTVVNHESVNPNSTISLMPMSRSALAAQAALPPTIVAKTPKIIILSRVLSAASGNVSYTGVGFQPVLVEFLAGVGGALGYMSTGNDDGTNHTAIGVLGGGTAAAYQTAFSGLVGDNAAGTNFQKFLIATMDVDGFTLTWTKTGTPTATASITATCYPPADTLSPGGSGGGVYVSSRVTGSFTLTHPSNAAIDQTFAYSVLGGA
jgi:hypothetical protein